MDFSLSPEQKALKKRVSEFTRETFALDSVAMSSKEMWRRLGAEGLLSFGVSTELVANGNDDILDAMLAMEGFGYGCLDNSWSFAVNAQLVIKMPIVLMGSAEQKQRYLPSMCAGDMICAFAFSEPDFGSDLYSTQTTAEKQGDSYVLNGSKKFISFGPIADVALVLATVNPELGQWGLTTFIVDSTTAGYEASGAQAKMGLQSVPMGNIELKDCVVSAEQRLGPEGGGISVMNQALEWERCCVLATQVGAMERQLEDCIAYARKRKQFGQAIGKYQSISNRIADMKVRLETSRLLLQQTAWYKKMGKSVMLNSAMAKLYISESFVESSMDAIRIHGGNGYLREYGVEADLRDSIGGVLYGGTSDIQRNTVARLLGL